MNKHLTIIILVICLGINFIWAIDEESVWLEFKVKFGKNYATNAEENGRKKIFLDNLRYIENHNAMAKSNKEIGFILGVNKYSDMKVEELNTFMGNLKSDREIKRLSLDGIKEVMRNSSINTEISTTGPWYIQDELDYRKHNIISRVKDQENCGSCWAFAVVGALESITARMYRSVHPNLSEQNLIDCSYGYENKGCAGGLLSGALEYVRDFGIMSETHYPYRAHEGTCSHHKRKSIMDIKDYFYLDENEFVLRDALAIAGPIPVGIRVNTKFFQYKRGVFNDQDCKHDERRHAVLIVGYGRDEKEGEYWIIKNSWGESWGEAGYMRMARNKGNVCLVATEAVVPYV